MGTNLIQQIAILAPPFLLALTFHEFCHGYVAWKLGDPTAQEQGRLTMNPLKHLDPFGVLAFIIMKIGWARPIPVNASYFRHPLRDMMWVSLAGPGANFLLAVASALAVKLLLATANLIPEYVLWPVLNMAAAGVWINLMLAFFNLIPIPPLDGSRILSGFLPAEGVLFMRRVEPFGFLILLLLFYLGVIGKIMMPMINFAHGLLAG
jgi:Zn-dependent protease